MTQCCYNCKFGRTALEEYGDAIYEYEAEDVYCLQTHELITCGYDHLCQLYETKQH